MAPPFSCSPTRGRPISSSPASPYPHLLPLSLPFCGPVLLVPPPGSRIQMRLSRVRCRRRRLPWSSPPSDLAAQSSTRCRSQGGRSAVTRLVLGALWPSFRPVCTLLLGQRRAERRRRLQVAAKVAHGQGSRPPTICGGGCCGRSGGTEFAPPPSSDFLRQIWKPWILPRGSSAICWLAHQLLAVVLSETPWPLSTPAGPKMLGTIWTHVSFKCSPFLPKTMLDKKWTEGFYATSMAYYWKSIGGLHVLKC